MNDRGSGGFSSLLLCWFALFGWVRSAWLVGTYMSSSEFYARQEVKGVECQACGGCIVGGLPFLPPSHPWTQSRTEKIYGGLWV